MKEIEKAIEILDKLSSFGGERAGRELWDDKPREVQDEDIANFNRDVEWLRDFICRMDAGWIPVEERLPENNKLVLVASSSGTVPDGKERYMMFYSNCFLEAVKHKLKDWKHVKITYIPPRYNEVFCPHFLWSDGENDYDFGVERHIRWWEILWFKGEIRKRKLGWNQRWKAYRIAKKKRRAEYKEFFPERSGE